MVILSSTFCRAEVSLLIKWSLNGQGLTPERERGRERERERERERACVLTIGQSFSEDCLIILVFETRYTGWFSRKGQYNSESLPRWSYLKLQVQKHLSGNKGKLLIVTQSQTTNYLH